MKNARSGTVKTILAVIVLTVISVNQAYAGDPQNGSKGKEKPKGCILFPICGKTGG